MHRKWEGKGQEEHTPWAVCRDCVHPHICVPTLWLCWQKTEKDGHELCTHMKSLKIIRAMAAQGKQGHFSFRGECITRTSRNRLPHFLKQASTCFTASGIAAAPPGAAPMGAEPNTCSLWGKPALCCPQVQLQWIHCLVTRMPPQDLCSLSLHPHRTLVVASRCSSEAACCSMWPAFTGSFAGCKTGAVEGRQLSIPG